jgi:hypothetical protein
MFLFVGHIILSIEFYIKVYFIPEIRRRGIKESSGGGKFKHGIFDTV